jgi:hypothetical protein
VLLKLIDDRIQEAVVARERVKEHQLEVEKRVNLVKQSS